MIDRSPMSCEEGKQCRYDKCMHSSMMSSTNKCAKGCVNQVDIPSSKMKWDDRFVLGVTIISKYMKDKDDYGVQAEHDRIWFGGEDWVTNEKDVERLLDLGWEIYEDAWSWTT